MPAADDPTSIGNILIELGFCEQHDIDVALDEIEQKRMGETLVAMDVIDADQLDRALKLQRLRRRQMSPREESEFRTGQRSALITELSELSANALAFASKFNGGS